MRLTKRTKERRIPQVPGRQNAYSGGLHRSDETPHTVEYSTTYRTHQCRPPTETLFLRSSRIRRNENASPVPFVCLSICSLPNSSLSLLEPYYCILPQGVHPRSNQNDESRYNPTTGDREAQHSMVCSGRHTLEAFSCFEENNALGYVEGATVRMSNIDAPVHFCSIVKCSLPRNVILPSTSERMWNDHDEPRLRKMLLQSALIFSR